MTPEHTAGQAATIARLTAALAKIANGTTFRCKSGAIMDVALSDTDARNIARAALAEHGAA